MTTILHFEVVGLAGRSKPYAVELSEDVNVFFGLNGSGKTTLLKILYAAVRNDSSLVREIPFRGASVTFKSSNGNHRTRTITKSQHEEENYEVIEFIDGTQEMVNIAKKPATWQSRPRDTRRYRATYLSIARILGTLSQSRAFYARTQGHDEFDAEVLLNEAFTRDVRALWRRYTTSLLSEVRQVQEKGLAEIMQSLFASGRAAASIRRGHIDAETAHARTNDFLRRQGAKQIGSFKTFQRRYDEDPRLRSVVENINEIEREIEIAEEPRRRLEALVRNFISGSKEIIFSDEDITVQSSSGESIPLGSLSSGEKQLVRILVETMDAGKNVVIVDEPELSMHIDWQHNLLSSLRTVNPDCQIIVATHSPEIMAEIGDDNIFRL